VCGPNDEGFAGAAPYLIGIGGGEGQGAHGGYFLIIKYGTPVDAAVFGFEDPPGCCSDVGYHRVTGFADYGGGAVAVYAKVAKAEVGEVLGGNEGGTAEEEDESEEVLAHWFLCFGWENRKKLGRIVFGGAKFAGRRWVEV